MNLEKWHKNKLKALDVAKRVSLGRMTPTEGFRRVSHLADRHPLCPIFFTVLGSIAILSGKNHENRLGYLALARLKGRHFDPEPLHQRLLEESPMLEIEIIDSDIHRDEARQSLYEFYGKGANVKDDVHLLTHLLLQDLLDHEDGFSEKQAGLYLAKRSLLLPLLLELESGLESILFSEGRIPDLTSLFLVLGAYATLEALPLLLRGLEWCTGPALNEAVLALVKTGRQYPREVTAAIRNQLERESLREGLINAVDVLGILGPLEGNYDHLLKHVRGLNLRDPVHLEMAVFTADALFRSGEPELAHEGTCLAEEISLLPESVEAYRVSSILDAIMKGRADSVPAGPRGPWQVGTSPEADAYPLLSTPNPIPILFPRSSFINDRIFVPPKGHKK